MNGAIIITGGSLGIGAATARMAADRGYQVVVLSRNATRHVGDWGNDRIDAIDADVALEDDVERAFAQLDAMSVEIGGLVNCAGVMGAPTKLGACDLDTWRTTFDVNVTGTFLCCRAAIGRMSKAGAIVNVSSMAAVLGGGGEYVHYAAAKGAVESLTIGLSREVASLGIRANAVRPGIIDTALHDQSGDGGRVARLGQTVPLGRAGRDEEVASAIMWLLSDQAAYVTGAILPVSGGR